MQKQVYLLIASIIAAPIAAAAPAIQDITPAMIGNAARTVAMDYQKSIKTRKLTLLGCGLVTGGAIAYLFTGNKDVQKKPENVKVDPTPEGIASAIEKMQLQHVDSDGFFGSIKNVAKMMAAIAVVNYAWNKVSGWFVSPERYSNVDAFIDSKTQFNPLKSNIEQQINYKDATLISSDAIESFGAQYAHLLKDVVRICGYMQWRIAIYKHAGAHPDDMQPFMSVLNNIVLVTANTNKVIRDLFAAPTTSVENVVYALAKYTSQIDIECGAFKIYETSYNKQDGF